MKPSALCDRFSGDAFLFENAAGIAVVDSARRV
jgi:hypothetical protein